MELVKAVIKMKIEELLTCDHTVRCLKKANIETADRELAPEGRRAEETFGKRPPGDKRRGEGDRA